MVQWLCFLSLHWFWAWLVALDVASPLGARSHSSSLLCLFGALCHLLSCIPTGGLRFTPPLHSSHPSTCTCSAHGGGWNSQSSPMAVPTLSMPSKPMPPAPLVHPCALTLSCFHI